MVMQEASMLLVLTYLFIITVNSYAVYLYRQAYYTMKKTKVIKAVYLLLTSLLIENIYFGLVAFCSNHYLTLTEYLIHPFAWMVPKIFLLLALGYFIHASLSKNDYSP